MSFLNKCLQTNKNIIPPVNFLPHNLGAKLVFISPVCRGAAHSGQWYHGAVRVSLINLTSWTTHSSSHTLHESTQGTVTEFPYLQVLSHLYVFIYIFTVTVATRSTFINCWVIYAVSILMWMAETWHVIMSAVLFSCCKEEGMEGGGGG